jgi:gliding motility-associated-like protein
LGIGDYEYALEDQNSNRIRNFQNEPFFENLEGAIYTVLVKDKNGCGIVSLQVPVFEFPKFFTPNGDGINDTWIIKGANLTFFPNSAINIFNRFGKLVSKIPLDSNGWNGINNGKRLPSDDYWFSIQLIDNNRVLRKRVGHFSLIR